VQTPQLASLESRVIAFNVLGAPAGKGSPQARVHNGHVVVHENRRTKTWEALVREAALVAIGDVRTPPFVDVPLVVTITFWLARPSGHWGKHGLKSSAPRHPAKKPDIDKLVRATLDPMNGTIFDDDSRIVSLVAVKSYADLVGSAGASIRVERLDAVVAERPRSLEVIA
jgi:Holliday junction resolvase RusA-like endonuclease